MKCFVFSFFFFCCVFTADGQTALAAPTRTTADASGNVRTSIVALPSIEAVVSAYDLSPTATTYTDAYGNVYPIYTRPKGQMVFVKKKKNGDYAAYTVPKLGD
jgi:hypothetical protein